MQESSSIHVGKEAEGRPLQVDRLECRAISIAKEIKAKDPSSRELFKRMLQNKVDQQRRSSQNRILMHEVHDQRIKGELQVQGVIMGSIQMQGDQSLGNASSVSRNAKGGRHCAISGKGGNKGKGRLEGGGPINDAIARLLATKPK